MSIMSQLLLRFYVKVGMTHSSLLSFIFGNLLADVPKQDLQAGSIT